MDRKSEILDAAAYLFSRKGYHATTVRDIAREVKLQAGSLYSHIQGKEEVLWSILKRAADDFLGTLRPIAASDRRPVEKLRAAIHAHVGVLTGNLPAATVYLHRWNSLSPKHRKRFLAQRDEYERLIRGIVQEGIAAGAFQEVDPQFATLVILSTLNWMHQWYKPDGPLSPQEIATQFTDLILDGLSKREPGAPRVIVDEPRSGWKLRHRPPGRLP